MTDFSEIDYLAAVQELADKRLAVIVKQRELIEKLEDVIHKATKIAAHIPYLCSAVEGSEPIDTAAQQLHHILIHRQT